VIEFYSVNAIPCVEADLAPDDVYAAGEMFCTGMIGELAGVIKMDEHLIGNGKGGPITKTLCDLYAQRTSIGGIQVVA
jgi:branched-chain amino acid aminotransferase